MAAKSNPTDGLSYLTQDNQRCAMNINLIDDTALIETTSIGNGCVKAKKILGFVENTRRKEVGGDTALVRTASIGNGRGKGKRFVGFAENMRRQEFGGDKELMRNVSIGNGRGKGKRFMGFAENMNKQELGRDKELMRTDSIGNGRGNEKRIMGFGGNLKRQEVVGDSGLIRIASIGNGRVNEKGILGFAESVEKKETGEDASLIETACGVENGFGNKKGFMGFADYQKSNGKKMKRIEGQNKCARITENEKDLTTDIIESQSENGCEKKSSGTKFPYSRKEMEALRFADEEDQKKKWDEIYCGLGPVVTREYDNLVDFNLHQKKHTGLNFDPRLNFKQRAAAREIIGEECCGNLDNEMNLNPLDTARGPIATDLVGCTVVEEECSEDDGSIAEYSSIKRPAFCFDSGPAQDGLEYLRRVRLYHNTRLVLLNFLVNWNQYSKVSKKIAPPLKIIESNIPEECDNLATDRVDSGQCLLLIVQCNPQLWMKNAAAAVCHSIPKTIAKGDVGKCPTLPTILGMDSVA